MSRPAPDPETTRLACWRIMSALQDHIGSFTSRIVVDIAGSHHRKTVEHYCAFLLAEKVIRIISTETCGAAVTHRYAIINPGDAPPLRSGASSLGQRQQALWMAMRSLIQFSAAELALAASTDTLVIPRETASSYIADLFRAGYLAIAGHAPERRQTMVYRLTRNSGPRAPIVQRTRNACFDLNLMQVVNVNSPLATGRAA